MCTQLANRTINVCTNVEKIQLKLQLQQTIALRISSLKHQQSFSFNIPGSEYAAMM